MPTPPTLTVTADRALDVEWLETDGLGGFSSSTAALANTRRYHAWFAPAVRPPLGRMVLWATSAETLLVGDAVIELDAHHYPETVHPRGHELLERFEAHPLPRWTYAAGGGRLVRELFLRHGRGDLYVGYRWEGPAAAHLRLRPLVAFRDYHELGGAATDLRVTATQEGSRLRIARDPDGPAFHLHAPGTAFDAAPDRFRDFRFPVETYRGLDDAEDLVSPGEFLIPLAPGDPVWIRAGLGETEPDAADDARAAEIARREALDLDFLDAFPGLEPLGRAADQFVVRRGEAATVIAGYPWFTDWGRDTMIALPGLTLATGRPELAREMILTFAEHAADGLIPNRFPDEGETPEYNTVDATLWLAVALYDTWIADDDRALIHTLLPVLRDIRRHHERGTRHGIRVDDDGLLSAGEPGVQLTWMDAKVDDWVVTPRHGKPVEIQALWYNFLVLGGRIEEELGGEPDSWRDAAQAVKWAFLGSFWDEERGHFADVIRPDGSPDWSFRPNQLFALSLPHPLASPEQARALLPRVRDTLVTPRGLRSLAPDDPDYHARYGGTRRERDAAYHQGTVWGWLHGPYLDALLRYGGDAGRKEARALLDGWAAHLGEGCLGQLAEVFDAETPFSPRGCPAQAWTVAEVLRLARVLAER